MTTYLFDANVLIALTVVEHEHHDRASRWAAELDRFALCPIVEGALVRFLLRIGESTNSAVRVLRAIRGLPAYDFWPDTLSYADITFDHVRGHRQVSDAYLASLAERNGGQLATLDEALAVERPAAAVQVPHL